MVQVPISPALVVAMLGALSVTVTDDFGCSWYV
jgi:hypothetical protein